jgi:hypothetical protein
MALNAYEREALRIEREEREAALQAALARKPDPLRDFVEAFDGTPFGDVHKRVRKIGGRPDAWPVLHRLLAHRERWVRPLEEWVPRGKAIETILRSLVTHLICRYPMPTFWYEVWFRRTPFPGALLPNEPAPQDGVFQDFAATAADVLVFVRLAQGEGLYRLIQDAAFLIPFTKRQCHAFMGQRNVNTVAHAVRWTQVENFGGTRRMAQVLCGTEWGNELDAEAEDFRAAAIQWFCNQAMLDPVQVAPLIDYMGNCREDDDGWSLKGRTARSLMRDMEAWHADLAAGRAQARRARAAEWRAEMVERRKPPPEKFAKSGIQEFYWHRKRKDPATRKEVQEVWKVEEILTRTGLVDEGAALRHCAASYAWSVGRGSKSIWSMTRQNERVMTIEVHNPTKTIKQVRGTRNRLPTSGEAAVVQRWAQEAGLQVSKVSTQGW